MFIRLLHYLTNLSSKLLEYSLFSPIDIDNPAFHHMELTQIKVTV
jgi:hypothetical protein